MDDMPILRLRWRERVGKNMTSSDDDTRVEDLLQVFRYVRPHFDEEFSKYSDLGMDCNQVYPCIYLGDGCTAANKAFLKMIGVTHVLNAAEGNDFGMVPTKKSHYTDTNIKYLGLKLQDKPTEDISKYFTLAAEFIDSALLSRGKVFVNCRAGVSRSATCVLAFLMLKRRYTAKDALTLVRKKRGIYPNPGFLEQLAELDNKLRRDRLRARLY